MPVELKHVTCTYSPGTSQEIRAVTDLSLKIQDGEFVAVMGRTGSGWSPDCWSRTRARFCWTAWIFMPEDMTAARCGGGWGLYSNILNISFLRQQWKRMWLSG